MGTKRESDMGLRIINAMIPPFRALRRTDGLTSHQLLGESMAWLKDVYFHVEAVREGREPERIDFSPLAMREPKAFHREAFHVLCGLVATAMDEGWTVVELSHEFVRAIPVAVGQTLVDAPDLANR